MRIGSLFAGIGGLELGLEWAGVGETVWQVEQDPYCLKVLERHWPDAKRFTDVQEVGAEELSPVDLICGGFPCQDVSSAGKGEGLAGKRSGLWFEFARIIGEMRPRWVVIENVASGGNRWVDAIMAGLEELDYQALPIPLSAADVGAPHLRRRIFVVAYTNSVDGGSRRPRGAHPCVEGRGPETTSRTAAHANGHGQPISPIDGEVAGVCPLAGDGAAANANGHNLREQPGRRSGAGGGEEAQPAIPGENGADTNAAGNGVEGPRVRGPRKNAEHPGGYWNEGSPVSPVCGVDDGFPDRVDQHRSLGNAVVPQCAEVIGHIIMELAK